MNNPQYIHLEPSTLPPSLDIEAPFAAVVIIDAKVTNDWRNIVSKWLVERGCLYMMTQGDDCSLWGFDFSVDIANIEAFDWKGEDTPEDKFVTTIWYEDESLEEVFYSAKECVLPFSPRIKSIILLDITMNDREQIILSRYKEADEKDVIDKTKHLGPLSSLWNRHMKAPYGPLDESFAVMGSILLILTMIIIMVMCLFV